jgi:UDP-N-acetylglucosamine 2-epimerase (non-hydrolysing)
MKITIIAGVRPNFIKVAAIIHAIQHQQKLGVEISFRLIHTGQHYDVHMSGAFFEQLDIPMPDHNLEARGGSQAEQTAAIMAKFEQELLANPPDCVIVVGDVTSTMACTLAAVKLNIKVAHVEAGIRSYDRTMPEEINRIVVDSICDLYYTTTEEASNQLIKEGVEEERIVFVGNTMVDTLVENLHRLIEPAFWNDFSLSAQGFLLLTLHRPSNVDNPALLQQKIDLISKETQLWKVIFPVHPRTRKNMQAAGIHVPTNIHMVDPLGYLEFMYLLKNAKGVITDSGGITEEATFLGVPCMTLRSTTERPETCSIGSNVLIGDDFDLLSQHIRVLLNGNWKSSSIPKLWDGYAAKRIVEDLISRSLL